jgi:hypothetical protein
LKGYDDVNGDNNVAITGFGRFGAFFWDEVEADGASEERGNARL